MTSQQQQRIRKLKSDIQVISARGTSDRSMEKMSNDLQKLYYDAQSIFRSLSPQEDREDYNGMQKLVSTLQKVFTTIAQETTRAESQLRSLYQALY